MALVLACGRKAADAVFPNAPVILISVDTLRSDHLPAYGYRGVKTPNIELRRDSILFARAYSQCPMTLPSHLSILTGLATRRSPFSPCTLPKPIYSETLYPRIHLGWSELRSLIDARFHYIDGPLRRSAAARSRSSAASRATSYSSGRERRQLRRFLGIDILQRRDRRGELRHDPRDEIGHLGDIKAAFRLAAERRFDDAAAALLG